ncbi:MAG TPA: AAA family ATPase, partial [Marmoricola sp.]|nr:AAA family ATPase [Marmoricola sp.]
MRDVAVIEELRISDLGVIKESVLPLGAGFTAITGETGAGKTMLITALGLLLGGRSESGIVREGATAARVEGSVLVDAALAEQVDARGGMVEEETLLISRQISAQGRSRAFLGGSTVPAAVLGEISRSLITIHGQADQLRLLRPGTALNALDAFGGPDLGRTRKAYSAVFDQLKDVERLLHEETTDARAQALELDLLRHGVEEISRVAPSPGEDVDLAHEEARLGAADNLRA